jgi:hypothetical protein
LIQLKAKIAPSMQKFNYLNVIMIDDNLVVTIVFILIAHEVCAIAFVLLPYVVAFVIKPIVGFIKLISRNCFHQTDFIKLVPLN